MADGGAASRFELRGVLGSGGNGTVHRARDAALAVDVALKILTRADGVDVYRFKREFRAFAGALHPNLVRLHDLFADEQQWFFTMELVDGTPFDRHVRPAAPGAPTARLDRVRLVDALYQVADALLAIHRMGKVHRDLKPANVLVEAGGRVVVLDYGLVTDVAGGPGGAGGGLIETHRDALVGSPAYMSPEQALDQPLSSATDWYSLGVMLYQALTGRLPFDGPVLEALRARCERPPPPPAELAPDVDPALAALCLALLAREPADRAGGAEVMAVLGRAPSAATRAIAPPSAGPEVVGRDDELAALRARLAEVRAGASALVLVTGPSGIGKTALLDGFVDGLDGAAALVLRGRCHERETVPYQAIDGLVDALTAALVREPPARQAELAPPDAAALARVFPALTRVPAIARPGAALPRDGDELRRRALRGFGELVWRLARGRAPVIVIDDLQWSDGDSTGALAEVIDQLAAVGVLVVAACRQSPEARLRDRLADRAAAVAIHELALAPLAAATAAALVRRLAGDAADAADAADAIARDSAGVPAFLLELVRARQRGGGAATSLDALLVARVGELPADARRLLEVCAVAARPLPIDVVAAASGCADPAGALASLRAERLVRATPRGAALDVEPFHDRVAKAVAATVTGDDARAHHRRLAELLGARAAVPAAVVVDHWALAGEHARAADLARRAAGEAEAAFGFHRAADLYRLALDTAALPVGDRATLGRRHATCLASAGRLTEAIAVARAIADQADGRDRRALQQLECECRLRHGDFAGGIAAARAVLADVGVGLPTGRRATMAAIVAARARARLRGLRIAPSPPGGPSAEALERLDLLWATTTGMSFVAPLLGRLTQAHHLRHALATGEPTRAARALCAELATLAATCAPAAPRLEALRRRARELVARCGSPELDAVLEFYLGYAAHLHGRWRDSASHAARVEDYLRSEGGRRWDLTATVVNRVAASWYLGDTATIVERMPRYLAEAEALGDAHAHDLLRVSRCNVYWLVRGRPGDARAVASGPLAHAPVAGEVPIHDYLRLQAHAHIDLYEGDGQAAAARLEAAWPAFRRSLLARFRQMRIELTILRGRAAIAAAASEPAAAARWQAVARTSARDLAGERLPWATVMATALEAAGAHVAGDGARARARLTDTAVGASEVGMELLARAARLRLAAWYGDGDVAAARAAVAACGVADPDAVARLHLPG